MNSFILSLALCGAAVAGASGLEANTVSSATRGLLQDKGHPDHDHDNVGMMLAQPPLDGGRAGGYMHMSEEEDAEAPARGGGKRRGGRAAGPMSDSVPPRPAGGAEGPAGMRPGAGHESGEEPMRVDGEEDDERGHGKPPKGSRRLQTMHAEAPASGGKHAGGGKKKGGEMRGGRAAGPMPDDMPPRPAGGAEGPAGMHPGFGAGGDSGEEPMRVDEDDESGSGKPPKGGRRMGGDAM